MDNRSRNAKRKRIDSDDSHKDAIRKRPLKIKILATRDFSAQTDMDSDDYVFGTHTKKLLISRPLISASLESESQTENPIEFNGAASDIDASQPYYCLQKLRNYC